MQNLLYTSEHVKNKESTDVLVLSVYLLVYFSFIL
jgi:hypothetical protein